MAFVSRENLTYLRISLFQTPSTVRSPRLFGLPLDGSVSCENLGNFAKWPTIFVIQSFAYTTIMLFACACACVYVWVVRQNVTRQFLHISIDSSAKLLFTLNCFICLSSFRLYLIFILCCTPFPNAIICVCRDMSMPRHDTRRQ